MQNKWRNAEARILEFIADQELSDGDILPSDRELAEQFACSLQPVLRAMRELDRAGHVERRRGARTVVRFPSALVDASDFSFRQSAVQVSDQMLENRILELTCRLPNSREPDRVPELAAQEALSLRRSDPFFVIARLRLLEGRPRAIHRAYVSPACVSASFLADYDFARDSLIDIYEREGYRVVSRDTTLRARLPSSSEERVFGIKQIPVLESRQRLFSTSIETGETVVLEYLDACYVDWEYRIFNRRAPSSSKER